MSPFIMTSQEFIDWYYRHFLPALLSAAAKLTDEPGEALNVIAADLRKHPEITVASGVQPILVLVREIGDAGLCPDQALLDGLGVHCRLFRDFIVGMANASYAELTTAGQAKAMCSAPPVRGRGCIASRAHFVTIII